METGQSQGLTDAQWLTGIRDLEASLPDRDLDPNVVTRRGDIYRRELGHLSAEQWHHAVQAAIRSLRWFPTIAELLDYAQEVPPPPNAWLLPPAARRPETPAEIEAWRQGMKAGLDQVREALASRGIYLDRVSKTMPAAPAKRRARRA